MMSAAQKESSAVGDLSQRREIAALLESARDRVLDPGNDLEAALASAATDVERARSGAQRENDHMVRQGVLFQLEEIERYYESLGAPVGISTGFVDLDKMTSGLNPGLLYVIGGEAGMGKTAMALTMACSVMEEKGSVAVSVASNRLHAAVRSLLFIRNRCDQMKAIEGFLSERDFPKLTAAAQEMCNGRLRLHAPAMRTVAEIRKLLTRCGRRRPGVVIVDDLHLLDDCNSLAALVRCCRNLKSVAAEHNLAVVAFCKVSRVESDPHRQDLLRGIRADDLPEVGADMVGILQCSKRASAKSGHAASSLVLQRNAGRPIGAVPLFFDPALQRFRQVKGVAEG
jgi:replicative DNA helicase